MLLQMSVYSTIPFMVYDIMRRQSSRRTALITTLVVLLDPFGLQWAHFQLPGWLIATVTVWALWLAQLAWSARARRRYSLVALASVSLGLMAFARLNYAPLVAVFGLSFFLWRHIPIRQRFALFLLVAVVGGGTFVGYYVIVHMPSTGTTTLSCTAGTTHMASLLDKQVPVNASNGPRSTHYAKLLTLEPERAISFYVDSYPLWRNPGPWVSEAEVDAFLAKPFGDAQDVIRVAFPPTLYWYLGPCASDALLYEVALEAINRNPQRFFGGLVASFVHMLIHHPTETVFTHMYLDSDQDIEWIRASGLGFSEANSAMYNGHRVWRPGIILFGAIFVPINMIKLLTPFACMAAIRIGEWFPLTVTGMLLLGLILIASSAGREPRHYAMLAPLYSILIGYFISRVVDLLPAVRQRTPAESPRSKNSP